MSCFIKYKVERKGERVGGKKSGWRREQVREGEEGM